MTNQSIRIVSHSSSNRIPNACDISKTTNNKPCQSRKSKIATVKTTADTTRCVTKVTKKRITAPSSQKKEKTRGGYTQHPSQIKFVRKRESSDTCFCSKTNHHESKQSTSTLTNLSFKNKSFDSKLIQLLKSACSKTVSLDSMDKQSNSRTLRQDFSLIFFEDTDYCDYSAWECNKIIGDVFMASNDFDKALKFYINARNLLIDGWCLDTSVLNQMRIIKLMAISWKEAEILLGIGVVYLNRAMNIASEIRHQEQTKKQSNDENSGLTTYKQEKHNPKVKEENNTLSLELTDTLNDSIHLLNESNRILSQINIFFRGYQSQQNSIKTTSASIDEGNIDLGLHNSLSDDESIFDDYHTQTLRLYLSMSTVHYFMGRAYFARNQLDKSWKEYTAGLKIHQNIQKTLNRQHKECNGEIKKQLTFESIHGKAVIYVAMGDFQRNEGHMAKANSWYEKAHLSLKSILHDNCAVISTYIYFEKNINELLSEVCLKLATLKTKDGIWSSAIQYVIEAHDLLECENKDNHNEGPSKDISKSMICCEDIQAMRRNKINLNKKIHGIYLLFIKIHNSSQSKDVSSKALEKAQQVKETLSFSVTDTISNNESTQVNDNIKLASVIVYFGLHQESLSVYNLALRYHKLALEIVSEGSPRIIPSFSSFLEEEPTFKLLQFEARLLNTIGNVYAKIESHSLSENYFRQAISTYIHAEVLRPFEKNTIKISNHEDSLQYENPENGLLRNATPFKELAHVLLIATKLKGGYDSLYKETSSDRNICIYSVQQFKEKLSEIDPNTAANLCFMLAIAFWKFHDDYSTPILLIKESLYFIGENSGIRRMFDCTTEIKLYEYSTGDIYEVQGDIQCEAGKYNDAIASYTSSVVYFLKMWKSMPRESSWTKDETLDKIVHIKIKKGIAQRLSKDNDESYKSLSDSLILATLTAGIDLKDITNWESNNWEDMIFESRQKVVLTEIFRQLGLTLTGLDVSKAKGAFDIALKLAKNIDDVDGSGETIKKIQADKDQMPFDWSDNMGYNTLFCFFDNFKTKPLSELLP